MVIDDVMNRERRSVVLLRSHKMGNQGAEADPADIAHTVSSILTE